MNVPSEKPPSSHLPVCEIHSQILASGFQPLVDGTEPAIRTLLWRCRQALEMRPWSGLDTLAAEDKDGDGWLTESELVTCLRRMRVPGATASTVKQLTGQLHRSVVASSGLVSVAGFMLTLSFQPLSAEPELATACRSLVWACRRHGYTERGLRSLVAEWLSDTGIDTETTATQYVQQFGLDTPLAEAFGRGLCVLRDGIGTILPSWRTRSQASQAVLLARFLRDVLRQRDRVISLLRVEQMKLEHFLEVGKLLGDAWSLEDLEEVALLSEHPGTEHSAAVPVVNAARLARAAAPGGFQVEFPELEVKCNQETLKTVSDAAAGLHRRLPSAVGVPSQPTAPAPQMAPSSQSPQLPQPEPAPDTMPQTTAAATTPLPGLYAMDAPMPTKVDSASSLHSPSKQQSQRGDEHAEEDDAEAYSDEFAEEYEEEFAEETESE